MYYSEEDAYKEQDLFQPKPPFVCCVCAKNAPEAKAKYIQYFGTCLGMDQVLCEDYYKDKYGQPTPCPYDLKKCHCDVLVAECRLVKCPVHSSYECFKQTTPAQIQQTRRKQKYVPKWHTYQDKQYDLNDTQGINDFITACPIRRIIQESSIVYQTYPAQVDCLCETADRTQLWRCLPKTEVDRLKDAQTTIFNPYLRR